MKTLLTVASLTLATQGLYAQSTATDSLALDSIWKQQEISEVAVTAQKRLVKNEIDKLAYDVQADPESKTSSVLDMLRKVPMVTVDGQDAIKVKGSTAFKIYRNGHADPSLQGSNVSDILKAIPAAAIKRIEVITDPGAKEDAEGTTYILNIVMNSQRHSQGLMGMVTGSANLLNGQTREGLMLTTQKGKLTTSVNYGFMSGDQEQETHTTQHYTASGRTLSSYTYSKPPVKVHFGDLNTSLELDSLNLMTLNFGGFYYKVNTTAEGTYAMTDTSGAPVYSYDISASTPKYNHYNLHGRYDYQHMTHRRGEVLTASYMLSTTRSHQAMAREMSHGLNMPVDYSGYTTRNKENFMEHTLQLDYVRPLGLWHKVETGAKYIYRDNRSKTAMDYDGATTTANSATDFKHQTQVGGAYMQWMYNRDRWALRAGLRYEYSRLEGKYPDGSAASFHKNLHDWVPSLAIRYKFSEADALKLSYATTINRPGISYLNPAVQSSPTAESYGNPELNSARNNNMTLEYTHVGRIATLSADVYYHFSDDQIAALQGVMGDKTFSTYGDLLHRKQWGTHLSLQLQPTRTTQVSINADAGRSLLSDRGAGLSMDGWNGGVAVNLSQRLPWKLRLNLMGMTDIGREVNSVYQRSAPNYYYMGSLQRSFLKEDRLTVSCRFVNLTGPHYKRFRSYTLQGDYTGTNDFLAYQKQLALTVAYRFGKLRARVKSVNKSIENNDVVGGLKDKAQ